MDSVKIVKEERVGVWRCGWYYKWGAAGILLVDWVGWFFK